MLGESRSCRGSLVTDSSSGWVSGACISSISVLCAVVHWGKRGTDTCSMHCEIPVTADPSRLLVSASRFGPRKKDCQKPLQSPGVPAMPGLDILCD